MTWDNLPLEPTYWDRFNTDEFDDYIRELGFVPESMLDGKTIAQIIEALYPKERDTVWSSVGEHPAAWHREISRIKKQIKRGEREKDYFAAHTICEVLLELYRMKKESEQKRLIFFM